MSFFSCSLFTLFRPTKRPPRPSPPPPDPVYRFPFHPHTHTRTAMASKRVSTSSSKRVHWADSDSAKQSPRTPSPTFSNSSGNSSPGPTTPPQDATMYLRPVASQSVRYSPSSASPSRLSASPQLPLRPSSRTPSPAPLLQKDTQFHGLLAPDARNHGPMFSWDMTQPVASARDHTLERHQRDAATFPPAYHPINIIHPDYMWAIAVRPVKPGCAVTVHDVLSAIDADMRTQVTRAEYDAMAQDRRRPGMQARVDAAFHARCSSLSRQEAEKQRNSGVRRMDFFGGPVSWGGLVPTEDGRVALLVSRH